MAGTNRITGGFVASLAEILGGNDEKMRAVVEQMRVFGLIQEQQYSAMNTIITTNYSGSVRKDGAETLELGRASANPQLKEYGISVDPERILPSLP